MVPVHKCIRKPEPVAKTTLQGAIVAGSSSESEGDEADEAPPSVSGRPTMQVTSPPPNTLPFPGPIPGHQNMSRNINIM